MPDPSASPAEWRRRSWWGGDRGRSGRRAGLWLRHRLRHELYRSLLLLTLVELASLAMPWDLRRVASGICAVLLNLLLTIGLGGDLRPGRHPSRLNGAYRMLGLTTVISVSLWFFTGIPQRQVGQVLLALLAVFSTWSLQRLVGDLAREPQVNDKVLMGAVAGYLFMGITGGLMVAALETVAPGSFQTSAGVGQTQHALPQLTTRLAWDNMFVRMVYFSFVSISTLGFGDIVPGTRPAMILTTAFTVVGPFYMAVVMGVLISRFTVQTNQADRQRQRRAFRQQLIVARQAAPTIQQAVPTGHQAAPTGQGAAPRPNGSEPTAHGAGPRRDDS